MWRIYADILARLVVVPQNDLLIYVNRPFSAIQYFNLSLLNISDLAAKFSLLHHKEISGDFYLFGDKMLPNISLTLSGSRALPKIIYLVIGISPINGCDKTSIYVSLKKPKYNIKCI